MDKIYYSPQNYQLIFKNLNQSYNNQLNQKQCNHIILKCMDNIWKNNNHNIPHGVSKEKFLYNLNSQIIQLCKKHIPNHHNKNNKSINHNNKNNKLNQMFDGIMNRNMPNDILDLPRPQPQLKNELNNDKYLNNIIDERNNIFPQKKNVQFEDSDYIKEKDDKSIINFDNIYEQKMNDRKKLEINSTPTPLNNDTLYGTPLDAIYDTYNLDVIDSQQNNFNQNHNQTENHIQNQTENHIQNHNQNENENENIGTPIDTIYNNSNQIIDNEHYENQFENKLLNQNINNIDNNIIIQQDYDNQNIYKSLDINVNNESNSFAPSNINVDSVITPTKNNLIEKNYFITINSLNRDLELYSNPSNFQVNFSPTSNTTYIQNYLSKKGLLIYKEKTIFYGNQGAIIGRTYDNILDIKCSSAIIPQTNNKYNVKKQPYLLLHINELKGPYEGTNKSLSNAFAKLVIDKDRDTQFFSVFNIYDDSEYYIYNPTSLGKLDKMTLQLKKQNQQNYIVGIDKLFINSFKEINNHSNNYCNNDYSYTQITINSNSLLYKDYCKNCDLNKTYLNEGDLLYFFDTSPEECDVIYFDDNVKITNLQNNGSNLLLNAIVNNNIIEDYYIIENDFDSEKILFNEILYDNKDYYIYLSYSSDNIDYINNVFLKVLSINNTSIIIEKFDDFDPNIQYHIYKFGFTFANKKGRNNDNENSLFSYYGHHIHSIDDTNGLIITIDFPFHLLPNYLLQPNNYVFFIQDKLQINYTFKITELIKDTSLIQSDLNY